jgi:hypothetical protein
MRRKLGIVSLAAILQSLTGCPSQEIRPDPVPPVRLNILPGKIASVEDTVAVLVHAPQFTTEGESSEWNALIRSYDALRNTGVPARNIFVLYGDGHAPSDGVSDDLLEQAEERFNAEASERHHMLPSIRTSFDDLTQRLAEGVVDNNDLILFSFNGDGAYADNKPTFYFRQTLDSEGQAYTSEDLARTLTTINPRHALVCIGSNESDRFHNTSYPDGTGLFTAGSGLVWQNQGYSIPSRLLVNFANPDNDLDGDEHVTLPEAVSVTQEDAAAFQTSLLSRIPNAVPFPISSTLIDRFKDQAGVSTTDDANSTDRIMRAYFRDHSTGNARYQGSLAANTRPGNAYAPRNSRPR